MLIVDVLNALNAVFVSIVDQLRFLCDLPNAQGAIRTASGNGALSTQCIYASYCRLVTESEKRSSLNV